MALISFMHRFAPAVYKGLKPEERAELPSGGLPTILFNQLANIVLNGGVDPKRCTIRAFKRPVKAGDKLYLYTNLRAKTPAVKLGEVICIDAIDIKIDCNLKRVYFNDAPIGLVNTVGLALQDGFTGDNDSELLKSFYAFFAAHPKTVDGVFTGQWIKW